MQKNLLIEAAKKTFFSYLKLDFAKEFQLTINDNKISLTDYVQELLDSGTLSSENKEHACQIDGVDYIIALSTKGTKSTITLKKPIPVTHRKKPKLKDDIKEYDEKDACELLAYTKLTINRDKNNNVHFSLPIKVQDKNVELGGPSKLPLYRSHLVTLRKMIAHLEQHDDVKAMLIALTTGSGKTFVQCLWFLTLQLAGIGGIFALPDHLVDQFKKDFKRLLPNELVDELQLLRKNAGDKNKKAVKAIKKMDEKPGYVIASYEELLDHHFDTLLEAEHPDQLALVFDEQHIVMENENRRVKLIELAKKILAVFSTATPDKKTFEMCANKPVAVMSAAQKKLEGQGDFPRVHNLVAKSLNTQMKDVKDRSLLERILGPILLSFTNAIEPDKSSPIMHAFQELQHYVLCDNDDPAQHRKTLQMPIKRKILALMPNNVDELVNLDNYVNRGKSEVYVEGNLRHRDGVFTFFRLTNVDNEITSRHKQQLRTNYTQKLSDLHVSHKFPRNVPYIDQQLDRNIYHNMIDNFLSDLTGLSIIELNKLRLENLDKLTELTNNAFEKLPDHEEYIANWVKKLTYVAENDEGIPENKSGIDAPRAQQVAQIMGYIALQYRNCDAEDRKFIVNNWPFDDDFHSNFKATIGGLSDFAQAHRVLFVMKGMEYAETPIQDSVPFFGFQEEGYDLYDKNGMLSERAKKIKRTPLQILDDTTREFLYTPKYDTTINETIADNLSKWGFVGIYASNKKAEGFSDLNLHTVVSTIPESDDDNNDPAKMIQSIGRNRGLDPTIRPFYLQATGEDTTLTFNLEQLEVTDDYYPPYFSAEQKFKKIYLKRLGKHVVADIKRWYHQNLDKTHSIDPIALKWQSLRSIVRALRKLNNKNAHDIKLSRKHLLQMLSEVRKEIAKEIHEIKHPYKLSLFVKFIASTLHSIAIVYYFLRNISVHLEFRMAYWKEKAELRRSKRADPDSEETKSHTANVAYGKIITRLKFRNLIRESLVGNEFKNILTRERKAIEAILESNVPIYLKDEKIEEVNDAIRQKILPLMIHFYDPEIQTQLRELAEGYDQWHIILYKHRKKIKNFRRHPEKISALILKEVPEIAELLQDQETHDYIQELKDIESADPLEFIDSQKLLNLLRELLSTEDFERVEPILSDEEQFDDFIQALIPKLKNTDFDIKTILAELKTHFSDSLSDTQLNLAPQVALAAITHFERELPSYFTDQKAIELNNTIREKILPLLIHFYDPSLHEQLCALAANYDQWHVLFYEHQDRVSNFESDPQETSKFLLSQVPEIAALLKNQKTRNYGQALQDLANISPKDLASPEKLLRILRELYSNETLKILEPIVSSKTKMVPFMAKMGLRMLREELDFGMILEAFKEHFSLQDVEFKTIIEVSKEAASTLPSELSNIESFDKVKINAMVQKTLPFLIHFYDPKLHSRLTQLAKAHDQWPEILFKHLEQVKNFNDNPEEVAALLLNEVPAIKALLENEETRDYIQILEDVRNTNPASLADANKILDLMKKLYTPDVIDVIEPIIKDKEKFQGFLDTLDSFDFESIIEEFKIYFKDELGKTEFILITDLASDTAQELENDLELTKHYDNDKISEVIQERIRDTIMHPRFYKVCRRTFGILTREELCELVKAVRLSSGGDMDKEKAEENADDIYEFVQCLKRRDFNAIAERFIQIDENEENIEDAFKNTKLVDVIDTIKDLFEELIDTQGNYHSMTSKGEETSYQKSKLSSYITHDKLSNIQTHADRTFLSGISRKLFYLQGLRQGLPDAGEISAFGNRDLTNHLKRIKDNIIRPLWWSSRNTAFGRKIVQAGQAIKAWFRPKSHQMPDDFVENEENEESEFTTLEASMTESVDELSLASKAKQKLTHAQLRTNYEKDAYETGYSISQLQRFTLHHVRQENCKIDTIQDVLDPILQHLPEEENQSPAIRAG